MIETEGNIFLRGTITDHEESFFVVAIRSWQECSAVSLQPQDSISYIESCRVNLHACRIILAVSSQAIDQDEG